MSLSFIETIRKHNQKNAQGGGQSYTPKGEEVRNEWWSLTCENDVGRAVIRFLPFYESLEGYVHNAGRKRRGRNEPATHFPHTVEYQEYFLVNGNVRYRHLSRQSMPVSVAQSINFDRRDYFYDLNGELYSAWMSSRDEEIKKMYERQKINYKYASNIQVINDPANPANNGKVFKFSYGIKILEMIKGRMERDDGVDIFCPNKGCDFHLIAKKDNAGFRGYENSYFDNPSKIRISKEEAALLYDIRKVVNDPSIYETYEQTEIRYENVLNGRDQEDGIRDVANVPAPVKQESPASGNAMIINGIPYKAPETTPVVEKKPVQEKRKVPVYTEHGPELREEVVENRAEDDVDPSMFFQRELKRMESNGQAAKVPAMTEEVATQEQTGDDGDEMDFFLQRHNSNLANPGNVQGSGATEHPAASPASGANPAVPANVASVPADDEVQNWKMNPDGSIPLEAFAKDDDESLPKNPVHRSGDGIIYGSRNDNDGDPAEWFRNRLRR